MAQEPITLRGRDVFKISVVDDPQTYGEDTKLAGKQYHIGRYAGKGFTCAPEFYADYKAGRIAEVTLSYNTYISKVDDPENPGEKMDVAREGWALDSYMTNEMLKQFLTSQKDIVQLEADLIVIEKKVYKQIELSDEDVEALKAAI